jgi:hypothetical protein
LHWLISVVGLGAARAPVMKVAATKVEMMTRMENMLDMDMMENRVKLCRVGWSGDEPMVIRGRNPTCFYTPETPFRLGGEAPRDILCNVTATRW